MRWVLLLLAACSAPNPGMGDVAMGVIEVERGEQLCVALGEGVVAAGSSNDRLRLWGLPGGEPLAEAQTHRRGVTCVGLGPAGRVVTGGPDRYLRIFGPDLELAWEATGWERPLAVVGFTPDGEVVGVSQAGELRRFDASGALRLERYGPAGGGVMALALSADGGRLAWAADGGNLRVWDTRSGAKLSGLRVDGLGMVGSMALSEQGLLATGSWDTSRVAVWDLERQVLLAECQGVAGEPRALAFAPDGIRLAVASQDGAVQVFDSRSGIELVRASLGDGGARRLAFDPAGHRLAMAGPGPVLTWFDVGHVATPPVAAGKALYAPILRSYEPGEDLGVPADGRLSLVRLAVPDYDPPELRVDGQPLAVGDLPRRVAALDGQRLTVTGYPLLAEDAAGGVQFLLSRFPPGCCLGPVPVPDEWIDITFLGDVALDPARRVEVTGVLEVGELLDDLGLVESLYRMQAEAVGPLR